VALGFVFFVLDGISLTMGERGLVIFRGRSHSS